MGSSKQFGRVGYPVAKPGAVIGLLGGSFDPPHRGHAHITKQALQRFGLDQVWWLVSPGNPLKAKGPAALDRRIKAAKALIRHPRVVVSDIERRMGTRYTAETLKSLKASYPGVTFVWLMGADNLASFHLWDQWRWIINNVPIGVLARPGDRMAARHSKVAATFEFARLSGKKSMMLPRLKPPCWCFINVPMVDMSSTDIRARGGWPT